MPERDARRHNWAPNEVMLELLQELEATVDQQDLRYVLALLLARRRVIRLEGTESDPQGKEVSVYYCPRRESTMRVVTTIPDEKRTREIQQELAKLLFADAK